GLSGLVAQGRRSCWRRPVQISPWGVGPVATARAGREAGTGRGLGVDLGQELRGRAGLHQRVAHGIAHEVVDGGLLTETDLGFRGMNVNVDFHCGHFQKKQNYRMDGWRQDVAISFGERVLDEAVANQAAIHKNENRIAVELLNLRLRNEAVEAKFAGLGLSGIFLRIAPPGWRLRQACALQRLHGSQRNQLIERLAAKNLIDALAMVAYRRRYQQGISGRVQLEVLFG